MRISTDVLMERIELLLRNWQTTSQERREVELSELRQILEAHAARGTILKSTFVAQEPTGIKLTDLLADIHTSSTEALKKSGGLPLNTRCHLLYTNIYTNLQTVVAQVEYARRMF